LAAEKSLLAMTDLLGNNTILETILIHRAICIPLSAPCFPASQIFAGKSTEIFALTPHTPQPKAGSKREWWNNRCSSKNPKTLTYFRHFANSLSPPPQPLPKHARQSQGPAESKKQVQTSKTSTTKPQTQ